MFDQVFAMSLSAILTQTVPIGLPNLERNCRGLQIRLCSWLNTITVKQLVQSNLLPPIVQCGAPYITHSESRILKSRIISACALSFVIGNWNAFLENVKIRRRIFYRLHLLVAGTYVLCCVLLTIVNSLYGYYVLKQFDGDSKIGPQGWGRFDTSKGWKVSDSNYKHEIEYEFGMAFYWNISL